MKTFYTFASFKTKKKPSRSFFFILALMSFYSLVSNATIRFVKPTATGTGVGSSWVNASGNLQAMIEASAPNDEVWVMSGTYKPSAYPTGSTGGTTSRDYAFILKNQVKVYGGFVGNETLLSQRTIAVIAVNPSFLSGDIGVVNDSTDNVYHVLLTVSDDSTTIIDGFTITKGNSINLIGSISLTVENKVINRPYGAGMVNSFSLATINNCKFSYNSAKDIGGGLLITNSPSSQITNCSFDNNTSLNFGGGLYIRSSDTLKIANCSFSNNVASSYGGGVYIVNSFYASISDCIFYRNKANGGGGIFNNNYGSSFLVSKCIFSNNTSGTNGGGIYNNYTSPTISNCSFLTNNANLTDPSYGDVGNGGAIYNFSSSPLITNCSFTNNNANNGSAMYDDQSYDSSHPKIDNCTFFANYSQYGGVIVDYYYNSTIDIKNSIIWGNKKNGTGISGIVGPSTIINNTIIMTTISISYSDVDDYYLGIGNINKYPLFVNANDPDGIDNIFGTADDGLALQRCSPAINAGDNTGITATTDITGAARIQNSIIDMGAYESNSTSGNKYFIPSVSINPTKICAGTNQLLTAISTNSGSSPQYFWSKNNVPEGISTFNTKYIYMSGPINRQVNGVSVANDGKIYVGTNGGLAVSTDGGNFFRTVDETGNVFVYKVFVDKEATIYTATNYGLNIARGGSNFTYFNLKNGLPDINVRDVYAGNDGKIYIATWSGVSISADGGSSFNTYTTANGLGDSRVQSVFADNNGKIYAATASGLSISSDGGNKFTNYTVSNGLGDDIVYDVYVDDNGKIYAATWGGLSISTDGGNSYKNYTQGLGNINLTGLYVGSDGKVYVSTRSQGVSISCDGGQTFTNYLTGPQVLNYNETNDVIVSKNGTIYVATNQGLSIATQKNDNSLQINNALADDVYKVTMVPSTDVCVNPPIAIASLTINPLVSPTVNITPNSFCAGSDQTLTATSTNGGISPQYHWSRNNKPLGISEFRVKTTANGLGHNGVYGVYIGKDGKIYVGTNGGLSISTDGGNSFTNYTTANGLGSNFVHKVYVSDDGKIYAATVNGLSISSNGGNSFTNYNTANGLGDKITNGVVIDKSGRIYVPPYNGLSISSNGGQTFTNKTTNNGLGSNYVWGVFVAVDGKIYAATDQGLSISNNGGSSFTNYTTANGLVSNEIFDVFVANDGKIYVATHDGISISSDGGASFNKRTIANGLGNNWDLGIYVGPEGKIYVATEGGVSISSDGGDTFTNYTVGNDFLGNLVEYIYVGNDGKIYAPTLAGLGIAAQALGNTYPLTDAAPTDVYKVTMLPSSEVCANPVVATASTSAQLPCTLPVAVSNLTATALPLNQVKLNWNISPTNTAPIIVERSVDNFSYFPISGNLAPNTTSFIYTEEITNLKYYYRVKTYLSTCCWNVSNIVNTTTIYCVTPNSPSGLVAKTVQNGNNPTPQIGLTWNDNSDVETIFVVERSVDEGYWWAIDSNLPANSTSTISKDLYSGIQYYYRIKSVNGSCSSPYSNVAGDMTLTTPFYIPPGGRVGINTENSNSSIEPVENFGMLVYPNPSDEIIKVLLPKSLKNQPLIINIIDAKGVILYQKNIEEYNSEILSFDLRSIIEGIYVLQVKSNDKTFLKKIILKK